jgi:hypothetical protein
MVFGSPFSLVLFVCVHGRVPFAFGEGVLGFRSVFEAWSLLLMFILFDSLRSMGIYSCGMIGRLLLS